MVKMTQPRSSGNPDITNVLSMGVNHTGGDCETDATGLFVRVISTGEIF
jgi:hypothetical protein